jgi:hypothetical protein
MAARDLPRRGLLIGEKVRAGRERVSRFLGEAPTRESICEMNMNSIDIPRKRHHSDLSTLSPPYRDTTPRKVGLDFSLVLFPIPYRLFR